MYVLFLNSKFDYELRDILVGVFTSKTKLNKAIEKLEPKLEEEFEFYMYYVDINVIDYKNIKYCLKEVV